MNLLITPSIITAHAEYTLEHAALMGGSTHHELTKAVPPARGCAMTEYLRDKALRDIEAFLHPLPYVNEPIPSHMIGTLGKVQIVSEGQVGVAAIDYALTTENENAVVYIIDPCTILLLSGDDQIIITEHIPKRQYATDNGVATMWDVWKTSISLECMLEHDDWEDYAVTDPIELDIIYQVLKSSWDVVTSPAPPNSGAEIIAIDGDFRAKWRGWQWTLDWISSINCVQVAGKNNGLTEEFELTYPELCHTFGWEGKDA